MSASYTQVYFVEEMGAVVIAAKKVQEAVTVAPYPSTAVWVEDSLSLARALQELDGSLIALSARSAEFIHDSEGG